MTQCNQCYVISTFFINFNTSSAACPQSHQSPYWLCLSNVDPGRSDPSGNTKYKYSYKYIIYNIQIEIWSPFRLVLLIMSVIYILCFFIFLLDPGISGVRSMCDEIFNTNLWCQSQTMWQCKWHHLESKLITNPRSSNCWPNLQQSK